MNKDERYKKLAEHIGTQVMNLVASHLPSIEETGGETEKGEAKVSFSVCWPAHSHAPKVVTKLSFTAATKDETEGCCDLEQEDLFDRIDAAQSKVTTIDELKDEIDNLSSEGPEAEEAPAEDWPEVPEEEPEPSKQ